MANLKSNAAAFGADLQSLHFLDQDGPELLPYATLVTAQRAGDNDLAIVRAVYEWQGAPLMFLVDAASLTDTDQLHRIRRLLAMRGDAPYLGLVGSGQLNVYRLALDRKTPSEASVDWRDGEAANATAFARLGNIRPDGAVSKRDWISNVVLNLLTASIGQLIAEFSVSDEDAISLVGRALFTRFLADRGLLPASMGDESATARLFDNSQMAKKTSIWLDKTFNGDLLPLPVGTFSKLPENAYQVLGDVLRRAPDGQLFLGWEEKWDNLDFAHIPVGVLSQAYELYLRNHAPARQRREGGYYTPRSIADLLVRASFRALERQDSCDKARVLDPAAGAGVFLLTAFRELVAEKWRINERRPDTRALRSILDTQIVGFDINEAALRFAALGLYLMSIELDPNPRPVDKLRFRNLRGKVLHLVSSEFEEKGADLGSLGPLVGEEHIGQYDLVVGNPPWASGTKLPDWELVSAKVKEIAAERGIDSAPPIPNEVLDIPFVWRAMEWAKPGGQITFALHARLLFQQGDGMDEARQLLFDAIEVTSVINGAELRQTKVWPEISAPFCLLFAKNRAPGASAGFRFVSPHIEASLNDAGAMRIDATSAEVISVQQLRDTPEILKVLFRGSKADLGILERIRIGGHASLRAFWIKAMGAGARGRLQGSGNGFQTLKKSSRIRKNGDGLPGVDARYLHGLPEVSASTFTEIQIDAESLPKFSHGRIHDPRLRELFSGPMAIVHQSPPAATGRIAVSVSDSDLVFNETFYGYSPGEIDDPHDFVRYVALVLGSKFATWFALVTSGKFGFERDVVEKAALDRIPFPDFFQLKTGQRNQIGSLYQSLLESEKNWTFVDGWVAELYGLGERDVQVISDTLEFNLPFADHRRRAEAVPTDEDQMRFCDVLQRELLPWAARAGCELNVERLDQPTISPWYALRLYTSKNTRAMEGPYHWQGVVGAADQTAASEIVLLDEPHGLVVGRLAQRRYWSETQARLLAQRIIWSHSNFLRGSKTE
ncbi:HsdM family class I SAM-dependent methyltransferase [Agrobacterium tumefaciens]|uniref:HsdM family class I SAM-dependent methyltransferase n=1 Tax=Agrobacterium tumefaciens TaxID=358 RepID=UPI001572129F|nr:N-6 DNA methylase [Agrobacterium tumefaciens]NSY51677.1 N-6 DNA methylase [Agrobacterium tumefaciens]NTA45940.1 N-6 DNA methylase [Agrobacterium tumefaciens]WCK17108.1 N-6 DNA methylase [Agrobacterium tumefaciens]WIE36465.1 N-6 DNA methylase [Agrobacterium tumefaciens]